MVTTMTLVIGNVPNFALYRAATAAHVEHPWAITVRPTTRG